MDLVPIFTTFMLILVTELGDKTQLAVVSLSCQYKMKHVFFGAMLAFLVVDGVSALIGGSLVSLLPLNWIQTGSGVVFIIFGVLPFLNGKEKSVDQKKTSRFPLLASFSLIALMELGDKSQIIIITLAAETSAVLVLVGLMLSFALLTGVAVLVGAKLLSRLPTKWLKIGTSTLFIILGALSILSGVFGVSLF
ncbi:MAG: TMEM165/GDT1 family protein [Candidatus Bathyarchaeota archaeon]|nr:TMEM165/GDT1 family protein [Candidatus Bathyarchaeota archaeon]